MSHCSSRSSSIAIKNNTVQLKDLSYKKIETGLSNDIMTEVVSGLNEGDEVVTKTSQVAKTTTTAAPSIFGNVRATGGAGANRLR